MNDSRKPSALIVIPTYNQLSFARRALLSLFAQIRGQEPGADFAALVVDDASPDWDDDWYRGDLGGTFGIIRHPRRQMLTAAWNTGAAFAYGMPVPPDVLVLTNSDVLFASGWFAPLYRALQAGWDFVGPLTNEPGPTSKGVQDVRRHAPPGYRPRDDPADLTATAEDLAAVYPNDVRRCDINGFCMAGLTRTWRRYAHDPPAHTFPPQIEVMPSGRQNPSPLLCGQEDWLCAKVKAAGGRTGACLGAMVWHYRGCSRKGRPQAKGA